MKNKYTIRFFLFLSMGIYLLNAQIASPFKKDNFQFSGYVKDLQSVYFFEGLENAKTNNIIHQRFSYKWFISDKFTWKWDQRTQFHYGSFVGDFNDFKIPGFFSGYADLIQLKEDKVDLSYEYAAWEKAYFFTQTDRLWLEFVQGNFEVKLGRQRINWGMNLVWNPVDIFNAFNFVDFDYEERPGSDAIYLNYYTGATGQISLAYQFLSDTESSTLALRYLWNKWAYDFQILGARYQRGYAIGGGWAGNIGSASFRSETLFSFERPDIDDNLSISVGSEYAFANAWMLQVELLYNSSGTNVQVGLLTNGLLGSATNAPTTLSPYKWSLFTGLAFPLHALVNANLGAIVNPISGDYYGILSASWSISENWELLGLAQITQPEDIPLAGFGSFSGLMNARIKYSF